MTEQTSTCPIWCNDHDHSDSSLGRTVIPITLPNGDPAVMASLVQFPGGTPRIVLDVAEGRIEGTVAELQAGSGTH
jgi:hypothetical protein